MQSDLRDIEVLSDLHRALANLTAQFDASEQEIRSSLQRAEPWIRAEMPAYWKQQQRLAERELTAALDDLQQKQSATRAGDRPAATEAKKRVAGAKKRLTLCDEKIQACRRHLVRLESAIDNMAGPLAQIHECVTAGLPRAMADLKGLIEIVEAYNRPTQNHTQTQTPADPPSKAPR